MSSEGDNRGLFAALGLVALAWCATIATYLDSYAGIVDLWSRSDTYAHGYVVLPISAYLVWRNRANWLSLNFTAQPWALLFVAGCLLARLLGVIAGVQALEHLAAIAILPALVWGLLGSAFARANLFPLLFLLFAVPIGDFLIDPMMEFTADFTVAAIRLTGIPVYREGLFFSLPSGNWSVVKACSGIRYIIASVMLGALFSYLTYQKTYKRVLFLLFSAVVPIFANGIRAVIIVLIGHWSGMELATGVDHLIYGWVFFGIVIFIMFWIGGFFADETTLSSVSLSKEGQASNGRIQVAVLASVCALLIGFRAWEAGALQSSVPTHENKMQLPTMIGAWKLDEPMLGDWEPRFHNPDQTLHGSYRLGESRVGIYVAYFPRQGKDSELVSSSNSLVGDRNRWRLADRHAVNASFGPATESTLIGNGEQWLLWHWYWTPKGATGSSLRAKIYEVWAALAGEGTEGAGLTIYAPLKNDQIEAQEDMNRFENALSSKISELSLKKTFALRPQAPEATH